MRNIIRNTAPPLALLAFAAAAIAAAITAEEPAPTPPAPPEVAVPEIPTPELPPLPQQGTWHVAKGETHHGRAVKFGQAVSVDGTLDGSLWAISKETRVAGKVTGDLQCTGERAIVTGEVGEDARLIVGEARVDGIVRGDLTFAGGKLVVGPKARVEGDVVLTGQEIEILGTVVGEAKIAGGVLRLSGVIEDDARVDVDEFIVDPGARIAGDLRYSARKSTDLRDTGVVQGSIESEGRTIAAAPVVPEHPIAVDPGSKGRGSAHGRNDDDEQDAGGGLGLILGMYLFLLAVGCAALAVARNLIPKLVNHLKAEPLQCVGVGFLAWLSPFAAIFAAILIVTIPLVIAYWLLFAVMMALAYIPVAAWIGHLLFTRLGRESTSRYAQFAVGLALWWLAVQIPVLGVMVAIATFLAGPGTFVIALREWWVNRRRKPAPPAPTTTLPAAV